MLSKERPKGYTEIWLCSWANLTLKIVNTQLALKDRDLLFYTIWWGRNSLTYFSSHLRKSAHWKKSLGSEWQLLGTSMKGIRKINWWFLSHIIKKKMTSQISKSSVQNKDCISPSHIPFTDTQEVPVKEANLCSRKFSDHTRE